MRFALVSALVFTALPALALADKKAEREQQFRTQVQPLIQKYCFECHGDGSSEGDFNLDKYTSAQRMLEGRRNWLKVLRRVNAGDMPPKDADKHPSKEEYALLAKFIDTTLNDIDCTGGPVAGHVTLRRLTRYEYRNTVRDLIGIDYEPASTFPADEVGYGFDNIGDVLSLPPLLLEKYLLAAEEITAKAILTIPPKPKTIAELRGNKLEGYGSGGGDRGERVLASEGECFATIDVPTDGEYEISVMARADQGGDEPAKMSLRLDGQELKVYEVKNETTREKFEHKIQLAAGKRKIGMAFINDFYDEKAPEGKRDRNLKILKLEVFGPTQAGLAAYPETHRKILRALPSEQLSWVDAAKQNLRPLASRAFRRPVTEPELNRLSQIVEVAKAGGDNFETGMQLAVQAVLASPHFLYRVEASPESSAGPDAARKLNDFELATRLSYFLWSTMPDDELFRLASEGKLSQPDVLEAQARRLLKDERSQALVENFAGQWLTLRNLDNVQPNSRRFRQWNQQLRVAMRKETELFIGAVMREDMSLLRLLDADFTFVNKPLAELYGIQGVEGEEFRKVSLAGTPRAGILTQASILTVTSNPGRTSPVKRGKWIMETLLNEPPPPPPPGVPELKEERDRELTGTLREKMKQHRADPVCNSCHQVMDSLGFALENYDGIGAFREKEGQFAIEPVGEFPSGEKFTGPAELRALLLSTKKKQFVDCAIEKMLTYALGRGLEYYDQCEVDRISKVLDKNDNRFSTLVVEIVRSYPFQHQGVKRSD
jgi:hypothetical protein